ncbi:hypothetical protein TNCV_4131831 [Trichonephila clavipes]|nr:hypothetical protein TNCV_4131831 [Trichonephila clavipes]
MKDMLILLTKEEYHSTQSLEMYKLYGVNINLLEQDPKITCSEELLNLQQVVWDCYSHSFRNRIQSSSAPRLKRDSSLITKRCQFAGSHDDWLRIFCNDSADILDLKIGVLKDTMSLQALYHINVRW